MSLMPANATEKSPVMGRRTSGTENRISVGSGMMSAVPSASETEAAAKKTKAPAKARPVLSRMEDVENFIDGIIFKSFNGCGVVFECVRHKISMLGGVRQVRRIIHVTYP